MWNDIKLGLFFLVFCPFMGLCLLLFGMPAVYAVIVAGCFLAAIWVSAWWWIPTVVLLLGWIIGLWAYLKYIDWEDDS